MAKYNIDDKVDVCLRKTQECFVFPTQVSKINGSGPQTYNVQITQRGGFWWVYESYFVVPTKELESHRGYIIKRLPNKTPIKYPEL